MRPKKILTKKISLKKLNALKIQRIAEVKENSNEV